MPNRDLMRVSISGGNGAAPSRRSDELASAAPDIGISGRSTSWASRYAIVPRVEVMVAPVRFISGQKLDTENLRSIAPRPPKIRGPITAVTSAVKWDNGNGVDTPSASAGPQHHPS